MGGRYSRVVNPYCLQLKILEGMSIAEINSKQFNLFKNFNKKGIYFLTKNDIAWSLNKLSGIQLHQIMVLFDFSQTGNVSSLDFWGALTMLSSADNNEKINHCFKMMDLDEDEHVCYNDLVVLMICVTRGVAKLRGYRIIPPELIEKMLVDTFRVCKASLNVRGELSMVDFVAMLLSNELVGQYFGNLGVAVVEIDASALVSKRTYLLKEAMTLQAQIAEVMCSIEDFDETAVNQGFSGE